MLPAAGGTATDPGRPSSVGTLSSGPEAAQPVLHVHGGNPSSPGRVVSPEPPASGTAVVQSVVRWLSSVSSGHSQLSPWSPQPRRKEREKMIQRRRGGRERREEEEREERRKREKEERRKREKEEGRKREKKERRKREGEEEEERRKREKEEREGREEEEREGEEEEERGGREKERRYQLLIAATLVPLPHSDKLAVFPKQDTAPLFPSLLFPTCISSLESSCDCPKNSSGFSHCDSPL